MKKINKYSLCLIICGALAVQGLHVGAQDKSVEAVRSDETIRPFYVHFASEDLKDLRNRIEATRWPDQETVEDASQGAKLSRLKSLLHYWGTGYDWKKAEDRLNALPQFITAIDGVDIHFIHVRAKEQNALPIIISHGWPGSVFELLKIIGPLTNPTAYGGKSEDAFDVVIPSLPGFGFSGKPTFTGWDSDHIAAVWAKLMMRLGYARYVAQGGDWGAAIVNAMARQAPNGLLGIHTNFPATVPSDVSPLLANGGIAPTGLSEKERSVFNALATYYKQGNSAYLVLMNARPQAIGYALADSPAGLAGWMLQHPGFSGWAFGEDPKQSLTKDEVLDDITLYWLTNTASSSARIYWENKGRGLTSAVAQRTPEISLPVAISVFKDEIYQAPESWARRAYRNLIFFHEVEKGGHFAAWEQPQLFTEELRAAFRTLR
jgi:pimeloyl-ACP methyl ester carboxylesterase